MRTWYRSFGRLVDRLPMRSPPARAARALSGSRCGASRPPPPPLLTHSRAASRTGGEMASPFASAMAAANAASSSLPPSRASGVRPISSPRSTRAPARSSSSPMARPPFCAAPLPASLQAKCSGRARRVPPVGGALIEAGESSGEESRSSTMSTAPWSAAR